MRRPPLDRRHVLLRRPELHRPQHVLLAVRPPSHGLRPDARPNGGAREAGAQREVPGGLGAVRRRRVVRGHVLRGRARVHGEEPVVLAVHAHPARRQRHVRGRVGTVRRDELDRGRLLRRRAPVRGQARVVLAVPPRARGGPARREGPGGQDPREASPATAAGCRLRPAAERPRRGAGRRLRRGHPEGGRQPRGARVQTGGRAPARH
mmetsp:Transcript_60241/g.179413  ORF Transcript_60241/g.179413 Transcript_60241/m.179413 type:complete len:207 (-) Transcript_60241:122-742(-)